MASGRIAGRGKRTLPVRICGERFPQLEPIRSREVTTPDVPWRALASPAMAVIPPVPISGPAPRSCRQEVLTWDFLTVMWNTPGSPNCGIIPGIKIGVCRRIQRSLSGHHTNSLNWLGAETKFEHVLCSLHPTTIQTCEYKITSSFGADGAVCRSGSDTTGRGGSIHVDRRQRHGRALDHARQLVAG